MFYRQKRVTGAIAVILLTVMLVVAGCGGNSANTVATVNGEEITRTELDSYMNVLRLFMPELEGMLGDEDTRTMIEGEILNIMVQNVVVQQAANALDITVSDEDIQAEYDNFRAMMGDMSEDEFNDIMAEFDIEEMDMKDSLRADIYVEKLEGHFMQDITDDEIESFIAEHPAYSTRPALLELSHILFEEEEDAQAARERFLAGEDFGDLAVELSEDPTAQTESHDGYRGYLGDDIEEDTDAFWEEFMEGANSISEEGEVSEPVETRGGWHLILLHSRVPAGDLTFEEARDDAARALGLNLMNGYLSGYFEEADVELKL